MKSKKINCTSLNSKDIRSNFEDRVTLLVEEAGQVDSVNMNEKWNVFSGKLLKEASDILGPCPRKHRDWFVENNTEITTLK